MITPQMEQLLLQMSAQRNQEQEPLGNLAVGAGAIAGGLAGVGITQPLHVVGRQLGKLNGRNHVMRPGARMAGGAVLGILGGIGGDQLRQEMISNSPEAAILARYQTGTQMPGDDVLLASMLQKQYSQMGIG